MTTQEMIRVQQQVAVVVGLLHGLDIDAALALMDRAASETRITDPIMWAKTKGAHTRMTKMMRAASVFQRTVGAVRHEASEVPKLILS